jgi:hypothetical protein
LLNFLPALGQSLPFRHGDWLEAHRAILLPGHLKERRGHHDAVLRGLGRGWIDVALGRPSARRARGFIVPWTS